MKNILFLFLLFTFVLIAPLTHISHQLWGKAHRLFFETLRNSRREWLQPCRENSLDVSENRACGFFRGDEKCDLKGKTLLNPDKSHINSKEVNTLVQNFNQLGLLYFSLLNQNNHLISPFSINSSLLMAYLGAAHATSHQMKNALHFNLSKKKLKHAYFTLINDLIPSNASFSDQTLRLINTLWIDKQMQILSSYQNMLKKYFHAFIEKVDFKYPIQASQKINTFFFDKSEGSIKNFLPPSSITKETKMLLTNALFLNKKWLHPFPIKATALKPFWQSQNKPKNIEMMHVTAFFPYYEDNEVQVLALPFKQEKKESSFLFLFLLPKTPLFSKVFEFFYEKNEEKSKGFLSYLNALEKHYVSVQVPKFHSNHSLLLNHLMVSIGIKDAFTSKADFSLMTKDKSLLISRVIHQSFISLNESGIFAGASSGISFDIKSTKPSFPEASFEANRPFLYLIADAKTHLILFIGECSNPSLFTSKGRTQKRDYE